MSLSVPAPFAVRLSRVSTRFGSALEADGVSKEVCWEVASDLEKLVGEVEGHARSVEEAENTRHTLAAAVTRLRGGAEGLQAAPAATVHANLAALVARLLRPLRPSLPLEVTHLILECVFEGRELTWVDKKARIAFAPLALVHSSWRPIVQRHVFKNTRLTSHQRGVELFSIIINNPRIASYITGFWIDGLGFVTGLMPSMLAHFTSLRNLTVRKSKFCAEWITCFPQLEELNLMVATITDPAPLPRHPSLKSLKLDVTPYPIDVDDPPWFPSLTSLSCQNLMDINDGDHSKAVAIILKNSNTIQLLALDSYDASDHGIFLPFISPLGLPTLIRLRCLRITCNTILHHLIPKLPFNLAYLMLMLSSSPEDALNDLIPPLLHAIDDKILPPDLRKIGLALELPFDYTLNEAIQDGLVSMEAVQQLEARGLEIAFVGDHWEEDELREEYCTGV